MEFTFVTGPDFNFLLSFGKQFDIPVQGDTLYIPPSMGAGFVRKIDLGDDFKLLIHQYTLNEELVLRRLPAETPFDLISIIFHSNEEPASLDSPGQPLPIARDTEFAVQISSYDLESVIRFPAREAITYTVVGLTSSKLKSLLNVSHPNLVVQTILSGKPGFLFYESLGPDLRNVSRQLIRANEETPLNTLFYQIKVQELLYALFVKLLLRDTVRHKSVHKEELDKLFRVRTAILSDLGQPPRLFQLARQVGMSETKLKELFKQIFGDSVYNYYQKVRMEEAAFLLKRGDYSVADVGNRLGFSNLSHFSKLFRKHYGINPKTYSSGG